MSKEEMYEGDRLCTMYSLNRAVRGTDAIGKK